MAVPLVSSTLLANGETMYYGRQRMLAYVNGTTTLSSVCFCSFFVAGLHIEQDTTSGAFVPYVSVTLDYQGSGGPTMQIYSVKVVPSGINTEIAVAAVGPPELVGKFIFCNFVAIGKPAKAIRKRASKPGKTVKTVAKKVAKTARKTGKPARN